MYFAPFLKYYNARHLALQYSCVNAKLADRFDMRKIKVEKADTLFKRLIGLIGRKEIYSETGLLIAPCNSIHMLFMRFSIDAIFIDKEFRIKKIVKNLKTWIGFAVCFNAWGVIEMNAGEADRLKLAVNQTLKVEMI